MDKVQCAYRVSSRSINFAAELLLYVTLKLIDELNVKNIMNKNMRRKIYLVKFFSRFYNNHVIVYSSIYPSYFARMIFILYQFYSNNTLSVIHRSYIIFSIYNTEYKIFFPENGDCIFIFVFINLYQDIFNLAIAKYCRNETVDEYR